MYAYVRACACVRATNPHRNVHVHVRVHAHTRTDTVRAMWWLRRMNFSGRPRRAAPACGRPADSDASSLHGSRSMMCSVTCAARSVSRPPRRVGAGACVRVKRGRRAARARPVWQHLLWQLEPRAAEPKVGARDGPEAHDLRVEVAEARHIPGLQRHVIHPGDVQRRRALGGGGKRRRRWPPVPGRARRAVGGGPRGPPSMRWQARRPRWACC